MIYCGRNTEHLHNDKHSHGRAIDNFLCWEKYILPNHESTHQNLISMWFSFLLLELPCYVTLLCGVEQLPNLISEAKAKSVLCLIPLVKAFTKVKSQKNQLGLTPDRCMFFKGFRRGWGNKTGRLPILLCYVTWSFFFLSFYCYL